MNGKLTEEELKSLEAVLMHDKKLYEKIANLNN